MQISTPSPLAASPAPANAPAPAPSGGEASPFAKMLSDKQSPAKPGAAGSHERPVIDGQPAEATDEAKTGKAHGSKRAAGRSANKPEASKADIAAQPLATDASQSAREAGEPKAEIDDAQPAMDPALGEWLATLTPPPSATAATALAAASAEGTAKAETTDVAAELATTGAAHTARGTHALPGRDDKAADRRAEASALASEAQARLPSDTVMALPVREAAERQDLRVEAKSRIELPAAHAIAPAGRSESAAAAPAIVQLTTPATTPEFREALAVQVSVLAKDGVQRAELHLNPAEMGPISVQIALQGTQAQVDFGAESFATRQIIEAGLPELAAALRDAGFTLAGGGVSQQSRGQSQGDGQPQGSGARKGSTDQAVAVRPVTVRTRQGGVDLYA
jgi:flagellar hook-length control protein FliK